MQRSSLHGVWWDAMVIVFLTIVAALAALPAPWRWATHLPNVRPTDELELLWHFWHVKQFVLGDVQELFHTNLIYYPTGTTLAFGTMPLTTAFAAVPVMLLLEGTRGLLLSYNLAVLASLVLTGYSVFLLVRLITRSNLVGLTCGTAAAFVPFNFAYLGQLHLLVFYWVPLFLFFHLRLWESPSKRDALFASLAAMGCAFSSLTYFAHLVGAWLVFVLVGSALEWDRVRRRRPWASLALVVAGIAAASVLALVPLERAGPIAQIQHMSTDLLPVGTDPVYFITPQEGSVLANLASRIGIASAPSMHGAAYIGVTLIVFSVVGVVTSRRRQRWVWVAVAAVFAVLGLGASLKCGEKLYLQDMLPYAWLRDVVPFFSTDRAPARFMKTSHLALTVLAGWGFLFVLDYARRKLGRTASLLVPLLVALVVVEYVPTGVESWEPRIPGAYSIVASDADSIAVCPVPLQYGVKRSYMFYQTFHGKAITGGKIARHSVGAGFLHDGARIEKQVYSLSGRRDLPRVEEMRCVLTANGVKYVVLHRIGRPQSLFDRDRTRLGQWLEEIDESEDAVVFRVF
ncbi:MAG: hypothetical protein KAW17_00600 [Candidatus Eisenbacteria sp.]|nr:hypothetical protein [Candidatus Eisenbacteria bacterium]